MEQPKPQPVNHHRNTTNPADPMTAPKRGRPATERGPYNPHPARQIGRVSDDDWATLKAAADARGESFTAWALAVLLRAAKRELKK